MEKQGKALPNQSSRLPISNTSVIASQVLLEPASKPHLNSISPLTMTNNEDYEQEDNPQECMIHVDLRSEEQKLEKRHSQTHFLVDPLEESKK